MSTARSPYRVVEQLRLDGGTSVLELYGRGRRTQVQTIACSDPRSAAQVLAAARAHGAEVIRGEAPAIDRPCPKCGATGNPENVFGFRYLRHQRIRQSWCRRCRSGSASTTS